MSRTTFPETKSLLKRASERLDGETARGSP